jgi:hypothetical protein
VTDGVTHEALASDSASALLFAVYAVWTRADLASDAEKRDPSRLDFQFHCRGKTEVSLADLMVNERPTFLKWQ